MTRRSPRDTSMSLGEHLEELRWRIIIGLVGPLVGTIIALFFGKTIISFLAQPLFWALAKVGQEPSFKYPAMAMPFTIYMRVAFITGLIIGLPWLLWQLWLFVESGLYQKEKRFVRLLIPGSACLTLAGITFMYYVVLPYSLLFLAYFAQGYGQPQPGNHWFDFLVNPSSWFSSDSPSDSSTAPDSAASTTSPLRLALTWRGDVTQTPPDLQVGDMWRKLPERALYLHTPTGDELLNQPPRQAEAMMTPMIFVDQYLGFVMTMALGFAIAFQTPLIMLGLGSTGLVTYDMMRKARKYMIVICFIVGAILTPPDVMSQLLMAIPLILLYEAGLLAVRITQRRKAGN